MSHLQYSLSSLFLAVGMFAVSLPGQTLTCNAAGQSPLVRAEGLAERSGDIALNCTGGAPNATISGNLTLFSSVNITNRVASGAVAGIVFTADNGSGPQAVTTPPMLSAAGTLVYNGVSFTLSATGAVNLRIQNLRVDAALMSAFPAPQIGVLLSFSSSVS